jgi:hypothetical protein
LAVFSWSPRRRLWRLSRWKTGSHFSGSCSTEYFSWEWCFHCATAQRAQQDAGFNVSNRGYDVDQTFARFQPIALSLFRFITGLLLFQYGVAKLLKFPAGNPFKSSCSL